MNKVEKIKTEIGRLKNELIQEAEKGYKSEFDEGRISAFEDTIIYINSLEEEPISNDLKEAAVEAFKQIVDSDKNSFLEIFKAGAQWQKQQIIDKAFKYINYQLNLPSDFEQHFRKAVGE